MIEIIYEGDDYCRLKSETLEGISPIIKAFSVDDPRAFFAEQHGYKSANTKLSVISAVGLFRLGIFPRVYNLCKDLYGKDNIKVDPELVKRLLPLKQFDINFEKPIIIPAFKLSEEMEERDYQLFTVNRMLKYGRGLFSIPTRGGKSIIIGIFIWNMICQMNTQHTLILVPSVQLVHQFYKDLLKFGYNENQISKFTGKGGSSDHKTIIISNKQYLLKHEDELPEIGCVIADEVHEIKEGSRTFTYIEHLETPFKFGCSGSIPKIVEDKPEKTYQRWCIESLFGSVVNKKTIKELQDEGYIAQLKINHIYIVDREIEKHPNRYKFSIDGGNREDDDEFNTAYLAELEYFKNNAVRLYSKPTKMLTRLKGNTLVLFDRIEFGTKVFDYLNKYIEHTGSEKNAYYIDGRVDVDIREDIRVSSESCDDNIIMAQTRTFSTGLTINNLHNVVFMFNSKAEATILQSIGRSLGLHESKEFANLYDISFNTKYATKQYMERLLTYMEEYHKEKPDKDVVVYI